MLKEKALENRGGSGILRVLIPGDLQIAEHNIILGLNLPNYPETVKSEKHEIPDVNGPKNIKTKEDVLNYLKYSFETGQRVIETITAKTAIELVEFRWRELSKLDLAFYGIVHVNEHYGQMVVYLRMCGIVPPPTKTEK